MDSVKAEEAFIARDGSRLLVNLDERRRSLLSFAAFTVLKSEKLMIL